MDENKEKVKLNDELLNRSPEGMFLQIRRSLFRKRGRRSRRVRCQEMHVLQPDYPF